MLGGTRESSSPEEGDGHKWEPRGWHRLRGARSVLCQSSRGLQDADPRSSPTPGYPVINGSTRAAFDVLEQEAAGDFPPLLGLILPCLSQPFDCKALQINLLSHQQTAGTGREDAGRSMSWGDAVFGSFPAADGNCAVRVCSLQPARGEKSAFPLINLV